MKFIATLLVGVALSMCLRTSASDWPAPTITSTELSFALNEWEKDYAVFLYAPWCNYCKAFKPIWHEIYKWVLSQHTENMDIVMFNCDENGESEHLCSLIGLEHYPSVLFVGHGSLYPNSIISMFSTNTIPEKTIMYKGDLFFEGVRDWCMTMHGISKVSQYVDRIRSFIGWKPRSSRILRNSEEINQLRSENVKLKKETLNIKEREKMLNESKLAYIAVAQAYGTGLDTFEVLSTGDYGMMDKQSLKSSPKSSETVQGLKKCMIEVVSQYCDKRGEFAEPYCRIFPKCVDQSFASLACRPHVCPLHEEGCEFASICLNSDILAQFLSEENQNVNNQSTPISQSNENPKNDTALKNEVGNETTGTETMKTQHISNISNEEVQVRPSASQARADARREALANFGK